MQNDNFNISTTKKAQFQQAERHQHALYIYSIGEGAIEVVKRSLST